MRRIVIVLKKLLIEALQLNCTYSMRTIALTGKAHSHSELFHHKSAPETFVIRLYNLVSFVLSCHAKTAMVVIFLVYGREQPFITHIFKCFIAWQRRCRYVRVVSAYHLNSDQKKGAKNPVLPAAWSIRFRLIAEQTRKEEQ